ncbi:hypothetical protein F2P81_024696 [Scophthalmus maximus]|uniref:Serine/threonine-protein phosphatase 4 regulatory subunit 4 n=1 Tax=Scophthalmus maximus TaxID=52904 RepID=A0A6A4RNG1_SCOMX|nr:hypothetical protein F2P81_024696 [Scophthalmus maximus]
MGLHNDDAMRRWSLIGGNPNVRCVSQLNTLILNVGQEVQRLSVISNLPSLVRQNPAETFLVSNAWLETLLSAINALPKETIKQETRLATCRIIGKVASKFDPHIVKKELVPLARSLCQDVEIEVRVSMCRQLESIARATGVDDTRTELFPDLVELARDEESSVRLAAFDTIINLMEMIDSDDRVHVVVPLVMSVCEASSQGDETVLASLSFQFGKLCSGLAGSLSDEQKGRLLQRFKVLCVAGLQTEDINESKLIRCNCCYNLPAMVVFADSTHFLSELYPSFSALCCDPEVSVRQSAAASFHQVVNLLGSNVQVIHKELLVLLQDDALEVLDALMNHLEETLEAVLSRGENLTLDNTKVLPVQKEAARTFCTFLRYNRKLEQRQEMMERLIQDLAQGRSYWNRLRFLDVCETATEFFSRKYFNKHFLIPALELVHDPVANVRYKLCQLLPRLRSSLRLPADKQLLQQLDFCVQKLLCREKDKDVVATIRKTVLELDKLDLSEPFQRRQERDVLDQKKEKEEILLLEMKQLERQQNEGKLIHEKQTERKRKEMRKAKLSRSRSLSSQSTSKPTNTERSVKVQDLSSSSGPGKSSVLQSKDDSLRTAHFTLSTQSTSSMPVLIRSNTTSLLDRASALDHRTSTLDQRDQRTSTLDHRDHRTSTLDQRDHRTSTLDQRDHRTSTLDQRSKTMDRGCGVKDSQSRKLSMPNTSSAAVSFSSDFIRV